MKVMHHSTQLLRCPLSPSQLEIPSVLDASGALRQAMRPHRAPYSLCRPGDWHTVMFTQLRLCVPEAGPSAEKHAACAHMHSGAG